LVVQVKDARVPVADGTALQKSAYQVIPSACEHFLVSIGCPPTKQVRLDLTPLLARPQAYAAGIIQFTGEAMTGSVVFLSDLHFFARSLPLAGRGGPTPVSAADRLRVRDLAMELSNQLLGRIKNQLYRKGIVVEPMLPSAVSGHAIRVVVRERKQAPLVYLAGGHQVFVWFEAIPKGAVAAQPATKFIGEGDFVEF
jgi:hypothetical protein